MPPISNLPLQRYSSKIPWYTVIWLYSVAGVCNTVNNIWTLLYSGPAGFQPLLPHPILVRTPTGHYILHYISTTPACMTDAACITWVCVGCCSRDLTGEFSLGGDGVQTLVGSDCRTSFDMLSSNILKLPLLLQFSPTSCLSGLLWGVDGSGCLL